MIPIFDSGRGDSSSTHVLAIGVGRYPHLLGGDGPPAPSPLGLQQLSSPPVSLRAISNWFLQPLISPGSAGFENEDAPLGTLHAVASAPQPVEILTPSGQIAAASATKSNIDAAFASWLQCLKKNPTNVGVFYFCGHGMIASEHYLLAEEFGAGLNPWSAAFDISNTIRAVEREVGAALYFLIDACRDVSRELAMSLGANPQALMAADLAAGVRRSSLTVISATGEGQRAFAPSGGLVSRFAAALIRALSGFAGTRQAGQARWEVDGETLASAVRKLLEYEGERSTHVAASSQRSEQQIHGRSVPLLRLNAAPKVAAELNYSPAERRALYELYLESPQQRYSQTKIDQLYQVEVPMGVYDVGAIDPAGALPSDVRPNEDLRPPTYRLELGGAK